MLQAKIWVVRIKRWASILGLFLLGAVAGIAYYHAYLTFQEIGTARYSVVRTAEFYAELDSERETSAITAVGYGEDEGEQSPDPCTLRDVVCEGENSIEEIISRYFHEDPETAIAIANAESGLNPLAVNTKNTNGTTDYGLWQINSIHNPTEVQKTDAVENTKLAREIYERRGWDAWSAWTNKSYKKYL